MPTLAQVRTHVDDWLAARWDTVVTREESYFGNHSHYWQGLITHTVFPAHTTLTFGDALADRLLVTPTDQVGANWLQALTGLNLNLELFPAALIVDAYEGPLGHGFSATVYCYYNATLYGRTQGYGPHAGDFTRSWSVVG